MADTEDFKRRINQNSLVCIRYNNKKRQLEIDYIPFQYDLFSNLPWPYQEFFELVFEETSELNYLKKLQKEINSNKKSRNKNDLIVVYNFLLKLRDDNKEKRQNRGIYLFNKMKERFPKNFTKEEVLTSPNEPYAKISTFGSDVTLEKVSNDRLDDIMYHIPQIGESYSLESLYNKLIISFEHSLYKEAIISARKDKSILAFSYRLRGFRQIKFNMDSQFKFLTHTNFGYGRSSYFALVLNYNDIPIIPYTTIVYYRFVQASTLLNNTQNYDVTYDSFETCFKFINEEINLFYKTDKEHFIRRHITNSLQELMILLDKIMERDLFYFVEKNKINSYLDLNNRHFIYDYEHFISTANHNIINVDSLSKLQQLFQNNALQEKSGFDKEKQIKEIISFVLSHKEEFADDEKLIYLANYLKYCGNKKEFDSYFEDKSKVNIFYEKIKSWLRKSFVNDVNGFEKLDVEFGRDKVVYGLAMLLSKYLDIHPEWRKLHHSLYNFKLHELIRSILDITENYGDIIIKKSGFELIEYRNNVINNSLTLIENIDKLDIQNKLKYRNKIINNANEMVCQNKAFLESLALDIEQTFKEYEKAKDDYIQLKQKYDDKKVYKSYQLILDINENENKRKIKPKEVIEKLLLMNNKFSFFPKDIFEPYRTILIYIKIKKEYEKLGSALNHKKKIANEWLKKHEKLLSDKDKTIKYQENLIKKIQEKTTL